MNGVIKAIVARLGSGNASEDCGLLRDAADLLESQAKQIEALIKDAERLDFLAAEELQPWEHNGRHRLRQVTEGHSTTGDRVFASTREAIDHAIKAQKEQP